MTIFEQQPILLSILIWGFPVALVMLLAWGAFWVGFVRRELKVIDRSRIADDRDYLKYGG